MIVRHICEISDDSRMRITTKSVHVRNDDFALRYVRIYPGVNSRVELVTLAPGFGKIVSTVTVSISIILGESWLQIYRYWVGKEREGQTKRDKRDKKMRNKITSTEDNALRELLPEKRSRLLRPRGHEYELPLVRTERFKRSFINRCLYNFV